MIIAATGHRPQRTGGFGRKAYLRLFDTAFVYLRDELNRLSGLKHHGLVAMSGMALGWDQAFASAAWNIGIPFVAVVPFDGQERRWHATSRAGYKTLLNKAISVKVVTPGSPTDWSRETISSALQKRNEYMVDHADRMAALWDGKPGGGTWNCLRYAKKVGKPYDNLYERWRKTP